MCGGQVDGRSIAGEQIKTRGEGGYRWVQVGGLSGASPEIVAGEAA